MTKTIATLTLFLLGALASGCVTGACDRDSDCPDPLLCDRAEATCVECLEEGDCLADEQCVRGWCERDVQVSCGGDGEACCDGSACDAGLSCDGGVCRGASACGGEGQACCGGTCSGSLECSGGVCARPAPSCTRSIDQSCASDAECCDDPISGAPAACTGIDGVFTCRAECSSNAQCLSGCCAPRDDGVRVCSPTAFCSTGFAPGTRLAGCGCWGYTDGRDFPEPRCASGWAAISFECPGYCTGGGYPYAIYCR